MVQVIQKATKCQVWTVLQKKYCPTNKKSQSSDKTPQRPLLPHYNLSGFIQDQKLIKLTGNVLRQTFHNVPLHLTQQNS